MAKDQSPILEIENLSISFFTRDREIPAVMDFSCRVLPGEAMGLVGESGCGKSTVALGVMQDLGVNGRIVGGDIKFKGKSLNTMSAKELRQIRGSEIAMIYQEPMASLNPAMRIGKQLIEVPMIHEGVSKEEAMKMARQVVEDVRLPDPDRILKSYPHQLSGGQQQRIVIAMALMSKPSLLILDEPTTALDVTVEAVDLVKDLGKKYGTSMLFISHNLGLVMDVCDRICVMYSGEAVETGKVDDVFDNMRHPYTQALFRSIPLPGADKNARPLVAIPGTSRFPMNVRMAVTLARAVTISKMVAVTPWKSRCMTSLAALVMTRGACAGRKLIGTSLSQKAMSRKLLSQVTLFSILMILRNTTKSVRTRSSLVVKSVLSKRMRPFHSKHVKQKHSLLWVNQVAVNQPLLKS